MVAQAQCAMTDRHRESAADGPQLLALYEVQHLIEAIRYEKSAEELWLSHTR